MEGELYKIFEGTQFNPKYYLKTFLGAGAYGAVFLADEVLGDTVIQTVALKAIRTDLMGGNKILQELQTAIRLRHSHLLHCITAETGKLQQLSFNIECYGLVMEVASGTLEKYLGEKKSLSNSEAQGILKGLAEGLAYLHGQRITHRDIKPANILRVGNTWKISDFGIAREMGRQTGTMTQSISGTPLYMPPEAYKAQAQQTGVKVAPSWDMWAYGVITAQLLTGELPFDGLGDILQGQVKPKKGLDAPFDVIVRSCLSQEPGLRMSAEQVLATLQGQSKEVSVVRETPSYQQSQSSRSVPLPKKDSPLSIALPNNGGTLELVNIPAGSFQMGSNESDDEKPIHTVKIKAFRMGKYAITQRQYQAVMGTNPSYFKGDNRPVEKVSWDDAKEFCAKLSKHLGQEVRLPTEAEWEYACRSGTTTHFAFGNTITTNQVNYDGNYPYGGGAKGEYRQQTVEVNKFTPNRWGLYQMHGNVLEWCEDVWHGNYKGDSSPWTQGGDQSKRMLRGGSWNSYEYYCRSASRARHNSGNKNNLIGFRVCMSSL